MEDTRYPYTYACDFIRMSCPGHSVEVAPGKSISCASISRSQASQIRQAIAKVLGMDDAELAKKLADAYKNRMETFTTELSNLVKDMKNG